MDNLSCSDVCELFRSLGATDEECGRLWQKKVNGEMLVRLTAGDLGTVLSREVVSKYCEQEGLPMPADSKHESRSDSSLFLEQVLNEDGDEESQWVVPLVNHPSDDEDLLALLQEPDRLRSSSEDDLPDLPPIESPENSESEISERFESMVDIAEIDKLLNELVQGHDEALHMADELDQELAQKLSQIEHRRGWSTAVPEGSKKSLTMGSRKKSAHALEHLSGSSGEIADVVKMQERSTEARECVLEMTELLRMYQDGDIPRADALSVLAGIQDRISDLVASGEKDSAQLKAYILRANAHCIKTKNFMMMSDKTTAMEPVKIGARKPRVGIRVAVSGTPAGPRAAASGVKKSKSDTDLRKIPKSPRIKDVKRSLKKQYSTIRDRTYSVAEKLGESLDAAKSYLEDERSHNSSKKKPPKTAAVPPFSSVEQGEEDHAESKTPFRIPGLMNEKPSVAEVAFSTETYRPSPN